MRHTYDTEVLVVGGGPAGLGAALAAARHGAKTLLVERHAFFGGIAAFCLGMPINQMRPGGKPRSIVHEMLIERLLSYGKLAVTIGQHELSCNVDYLKVAALDILDQAGCRYLLHTAVADTLVEHGGVCGVVVATKQGLTTIRAQVVVDCSGDADAAYFAGAETMKEEGNLSPMTLCINVTNIDMEKTAAFISNKARWQQFIEQAHTDYPLIPPSLSIRRFPSSNSIIINHAGTRDLGQFDGTIPEQLTAAEAVSRRQALQMVEALRHFGGEGFEQAELIGTGPQVGVRETRRVKGLYVLTEDDALSGRRFDDAIAWRSGYLDVGFVRFETMKVHQVPYRAIVPEKIDGLLMAGRCISASHVAASAGKSMGNCMATGHAAGLAAALSVRKRILPRDLPVRELQDGLRQDGVDLTCGGEDQDPHMPA